MQRTSVGPQQAPHPQGQLQTMTVVVGGQAVQSTQASMKQYFWPGHTASQSGNGPTH